MVVVVVVVVVVMVVVGVGVGVGGGGGMSKSLYRERVVHHQQVWVCVERPSLF